ncbi:MAG: hypothetical protein H0U78_03555 [Rickettsiaceae bacterium]|nr:hypothetical protein [Rickettsiaceae bacterium]
MSVEEDGGGEEFVLKRVLLVLGSMQPLIVKKELQGDGIYKNDTLFCLVDGNDVYFNPGSYPHLYHMDKTIRLPFRRLKDINAILQSTVEKDEKDGILQCATESYWLMSGVKKN